MSDMKHSDQPTPANTWEPILGRGNKPDGTGARNACGANSIDPGRISGGNSCRKRAR